MHTHNPAVLVLLKFATGIFQEQVQVCLLYVEITGEGYLKKLLICYVNWYAQSYKKYVLIKSTKKNNMNCISKKQYALLMG